MIALFYLLQECIICIYHDIYFFSANGDEWPATDWLIYLFYQNDIYYYTRTLKYSSVKIAQR